MGARENGPTLEGLAQKLEGMQRENAERLEALERENARLRSKVATLEGSGARRERLAEMEGSETRPDGEAVSVPEGRVSRRALLAKAGAAAVAAVAAGTLLNPREAKATVTYTEPVVVETGGAEGNRTVIGGAGAGVSAINEHFAGGHGVHGHAFEDVSAGVYGENNVGDGVKGETRGDHASGVYGVYTGSGQGYGVTGDGKGNTAAGVLGRNPSGNGVWGASGQTDHSGVYGNHFGASGYGVTGDGKGAKAAGVWGRNATGYGGRFEGGRAQLFLKPAGSAGRPAGSHAKGEVYMDAGANLYVCVRAGTPGTWRRVQTVAV